MLLACSKNATAPEEPAPIQYTLTLNAEEGGTISPDANGAYNVGAGMALDADGITTAQAFGASLIALGITVLRFPWFVGNLKEAITTAMMAHTTFVVLIGVHLINGQAEGPTPVINIVLNLIFITLYFMARRKV